MRRKMSMLLCIIMAVTTVLASSEGVVRAEAAGAADNEEQEAGMVNKNPASVSQEKAAVSDKAESSLVVDFVSGKKTGEQKGNFYVKNGVLYGYFPDGDKMYTVHDVTIPEELGITEIAAEAFAHSMVRKVTIPGTVKKIGKWAFAGCFSLEEVKIPASVTSIGDAVFSSCSKLKKVDVGSSNKNYISDGGVLFNKSKTKLITYPAAKTTKKYTIPKTVTGISDWAFSGAFNLQEVIVPSGIKAIGEGVFAWNSNLTKITLPDSVTSIESWAFKQCRKLKTFSIPSKTKKIGAYAFDNCNTITKFTIPKTVTNIERYAFWQCYGLKEIAVASGNTKYSSKSGVLFNKAKTKLIMYPINKSAAKYSVPSTVATMEERTFYLNSNIKEVTISAKVKKIPMAAFMYCNNLEKVSLPDKLTSIGGSAFSECFRLKKITIPDNVTKIESWSFSGCSSLSQAVIPVNVSSIGEYAFAYCDLNKFIILTKNVKIGNDTLGNWSGKNTTVYGKSGSTAQTYAKKNGHPFVKLTQAQFDSYINVKKPAGVKAVSAGSASIKVSWGEVAGASGYQVYRSTKSGSGYKKIATVNASKTAYTNSKVATGKKYYYKVRAYKKIDSKTYYSGDSSKAAGKAMPPKVTGVKVKKSGTKNAVVSWKKASTVSGYQIYRSTSQKGTYKKVGTVSSSKKSYTDKGLKKGTTYYYKMKAYRKVSGKTYTGSYSSVVKVKR